MSIRLLFNLKRLQKGATLIEYAIMVGVIAAVVITAVGVLGQKTNALYSNAVEKYPSNG
jgi:Flp pilus assembly pilin Flp